MELLYLGTGASSCKDYDGLYQVSRSGIASGIRHFDTAPSYRTEAILGEVLGVLAIEFDLRREDYFIQTKIDPWQMQDGNTQWFVEDVLNKMKVDYLDSLLIHWPVPEYMEHTWNDLVSLYRCGMVKKIGVCNVRTRHIERMLYYDMPPQIVQIERNPLRTCVKEVNICHQYGIEVQAYSPLCKMDERIRDNQVLKAIAMSHSKSIGQVVMRWHVDTGVVPVFTSKRPERIREYASILDFCLSEDEIRAVSALNENYKMYLESCICPGL